MIARELLSDGTRVTEKEEWPPRSIGSRDQRTRHHLESRDEALVPLRERSVFCQPRPALSVYGFLYNGTTYTSIDHPLAGSMGTFAFGISGDIITGTYYDTNGNFHGYDVPEPGSFALLIGMCMVGAGFIGRRRRK